MRSLFVWFKSLDITTKGISMMASNRFWWCFMGTHRHTLLLETWPFPLKQMDLSCWKWWLVAARHVCSQGNECNWMYNICIYLHFAYYIHLKSMYCTYSEYLLVTYSVLNHERKSKWSQSDGKNHPNMYGCKIWMFVWGKEFYKSPRWGWFPVHWIKPFNIFLTFWVSIHYDFRIVNHGVFSLQTSSGWCANLEKWWIEAHHDEKLISTFF